MKKWNTDDLKFMFIKLIVYLNSLVDVIYAFSSLNLSSFSQVDEIKSPRSRSTTRVNHETVSEDDVVSRGKLNSLRWLTDEKETRKRATFPCNNRKAFHQALLHNVEDWGN